MSRWPAIVIGVLTGGALALAGCGGGEPAGSGPAPVGPSSPVASSPASPKPTTAPAPGTTPVPVADLQASELVPFTGDTVTLTAQAAAGPQWIRLAAATVALGDGTTATVTGRCSGTSLPPASSGLPIRHAYHHTGVVSPRLLAATPCGHASAAGRTLAGPSVSLRVLPTAPTASASWPPCSPRLVRVSATGTGAGLGHVGVLFTLHNASSASCRMDGYPGLQLLGSSGQRLPTAVVRAVSGAYLFPAVAPHRVALPPGGVASFDLEYGDNPVGAAANEPYAAACPAATRVEVTLPATSDHSVAPASMAPCGGQVLVSPVVPGAHWLTP